MRIQAGDIMRLGGRDFVVKGNLYESRFGIGDQPKYWVFSAVDLETREPKIIKTVFHEEFNVHIGKFRIHCYRSPQKEAQVLDTVRGDLRFMQGYTVKDDKDNHVRVIDHIKGPSIFEYVYHVNKPHEEYFYEDLPHILRQLAVCIGAIGFLHEQGTCHGDIRNDHVIIESGTGRYRWIDFDLNQHVSDYDVWSMGNILNYAIGKGITAFKKVFKSEEFSAEVRDRLCPDDASGFYDYRIMNLRKVYPYISERLNSILLHFTVRPQRHYATMAELLTDYTEMLDTEFPGD
jgi:tRNA A-37 threonylcarbamoyl transferase component Bud32